LIPEESGKVIVAIQTLAHACFKLFKTSSKTGMVEAMNTTIGNILMEPLFHHMLFVFHEDFSWSL